MIRYYIIAALVFVAIITIEQCFPVCAGSVALALVLSNGKASYSD